MLSKMVYGPFIGIMKNYFNGILHLLDINRKAGINCKAVL